MEEARAIPWMCVGSGIIAVETVECRREDRYVMKADRQIYSVTRSTKSSDTGQLWVEIAEKSKYKSDQSPRSSLHTHVKHELGCGVQDWGIGLRCEPSGSGPSNFTVDSGRAVVLFHLGVGVFVRGVCLFECASGGEPHWLRCASLC
jgi:hypothetical protein